MQAKCTSIRIENSYLPILQSFARELCVWARLRHTNVVPLLGITVVDRVPSLASEWMDNGTVIKFIKAQPGVSRLLLVSFHFDSRVGFGVMCLGAQASGIANGLEYIHSRGVVHSDLKGVSPYAV